jgi:pyocin large subunit-like protein
MIKLIYKYVLGSVLFSLIFAGLPFYFAQESSAQVFEAVKAGNFAPGQLEAHFLKHGYQFGQITQEQYLQGAQALLDAEAEGDILEKIRQNGDIEHFRVSTGEFAVMTKRGRIRTYFKTDYEYWMRQQ